MHKSHTFNNDAIEYDYRYNYSPSVIRLPEGEYHFIARHAVGVSSKFKIVHFLQ